MKKTNSAHLTQIFLTGFLFCSLIFITGCPYIRGEGIYVSTIPPFPGTEEEKAYQEQLKAQGGKSYLFPVPGGGMTTITPPPFESPPSPPTALTPFDETGIDEVILGGAVPSQKEKVKVATATPDLVFDFTPANDPIHLLPC